MQTDPSTGNPLANYANVCTALELLTFMLHVLPKPVLLAGFKTLSKGLTICMTCGSTKVVRFVHTMLTKLMGMFPTEPGTVWGGGGGGVGGSPYVYCVKV